MEKRKILFKGRLIEQEYIEYFGNWFFGDLIQYANGQVAIRQQETGAEYLVDPRTVCQSIEVLDKTNDLLFHHDLVYLFGNTNEVHDIVFCDGSYGYKTDHSFYPFSSHGGIKIYNGKTNDIEKVGNRWDRLIINKK